MEARNSMIAPPLMDPRSEANLVQVHPDLCRIVRLAAQTCASRFIVIHGIRTAAEEAANVAKGASQTMHSRHLPNKDGVACAIDVMAMINSAADWAAKDYQPIAAAMLSAAHELGLTVEWGGNWVTLKDWGHFQLPWATYP